ncbi:hypothetical protein N7465_000789 [Penicillium sp. CMV-2018d]|nr:hypothetical protein N7465_000789 [Penicillium sp. CMV-2018d]
MFNDQAQSIESLLVASNDRTQNSPTFDNALNAIVPRKENPLVLWAVNYQTKHQTLQSHGLVSV